MQVWGVDGHFLNAKLQAIKKVGLMQHPVRGDMGTWEVGTWRARGRGMGSCCAPALCKGAGKIALRNGTGPIVLRCGRRTIRNARPARVEAVGTFDRSPLPGLVHLGADQHAGSTAI